MRVLGVRQLMYREIERVDPNAMHGLFVSLSGFASHQKPTFGNPNHARLVKCAQRKIGVMDRRGHRNYFATVRVMLAVHCRRVRVTLRLANEIDEEPVCTGHTCRQFPEERQASVDISSFSKFRFDKSAIVLGFTRIRQAKNWLIVRIESAEIIEPALLHPTLEILLCNFIGEIQKLALWSEKIYRRICVGGSRRRIRHL